MSLDTIIEFRDSFVDLKTDETIEHEFSSFTIHRPIVLTNYQQPYNINDINLFEQYNIIELPEELKSYLTTVSKSLYKKHLEFSIIELNNNPNLKKPCVLRRDIQLSPNIDEDDVELYNNDPLLNFHGMMNIREIGCGSNVKIVLNGKYKGTIWREHFINDGCILKIYDSFFEYVLDFENKFDTY